MDHLPPELFPAILGHMSERDRIRTLSTCKRMREWLLKRQPIADAAFEGFKTEVVKQGWRVQDNLTVCTSGAFIRPRGEVCWTESVSLEENSLIRVVSTRTFISSWGKVLDPLTDVRYFSPWFHASTTWKGHSASTEIPDNILQILLSVSPCVGKGRHA